MVDTSVWQQINRNLWTGCAMLGSQTVCSKLKWTKTGNHQLRCLNNLTVACSRSLLQASRILTSELLPPMDTLGSWPFLSALTTHPGWMRRKCLTAPSFPCRAAWRIFEPERPHSWHCEKTSLDFGQGLAWCFICFQGSGESKLQISHPAEFPQQVPASAASACS